MTNVKTKKNDSIRFKELLQYMGKGSVLKLKPQLYINFGNKWFQDQCYLTFLSSLTKSKTKHQENLAVMVKFDQKTN